jgi:hypothetical protein
MSVETLLGTGTGVIAPTPLERVGYKVGGAETPFSAVNALMDGRRPALEAFHKSIGNTDAWIAASTVPELRAEAERTITAVAPVTYDMMPEELSDAIDNLQNDPERLVDYLNFLNSRGNGVSVNLDPVNEAYSRLQNLSSIDPNSVTRADLAGVVDDALLGNWMQADINKIVSEGKKVNSTVWTPDLEAIYVEIAQRKVNEGNYLARFLGEAVEQAHQQLTDTIANNMPEYRQIGQRIYDAVSGNPARALTTYKVIKDDSIIKFDKYKKGWEQEAQAQRIADITARKTEARILRSLRG